MSFIERDPSVNLIKERFKLAGIEGVLLDLDDTIIHTSEVFTRFITEYIDQVSEKIGVDRNEFANSLDELNISLHKKYGVNPKRWEGVVELLAYQYPYFSDEIVSRLSILSTIYTTLPREKLGAVTTLKTFNDAGLRMGLVTHANVEWTNWKMDKLGLWRYFDTVIIADENFPKGVEHWAKGAESLGLPPTNCLVVGDNLKGDIQPADSLGMKTAWIPSPWAVYREGFVPERTIRINEIHELLSIEDWVR